MTIVQKPHTFLWRACQVLALIVAFWLLLPAFTSVHVEGFTAQIQSLAMRLAQQGDIHSHDLTRPRVSDFIFLTRAGVVDVLAGAYILFGYVGDSAFRILTICSLVILLVATAAAARRVASISLSCALLACVAVPGLVELGFHFNDNVVSAAFFSLALLLVLWNGSLTAAALGGAAFAAALLCRVDAVLGAPLLFLFFFHAKRPFPEVVKRIAWSGIAALVILALAGWLNKGNLIDGIRIAREFTVTHFHDKGLFPGIDPILHFFGPLGTVIVAVGATRLFSKGPDGWPRLVWICGFYVYPIALLIYVLFRSLELRYFMPLLAVVIGVHGGHGVRALIEWARGPDVRMKRWAWVAAAFTVAVLCLPPVKSIMRDGPRLFVGRLWSIPAWLEWQQSVDFSMLKVSETLLDLSSEPSSVVVTTAWNDEFYLRLRLFELGYREVDVEKECRPLSHYRLGDRDIWHVRTDPQYALPPFTRLVSTELAIYGASHCPSINAELPVWITTFGALQPEAIANGVEQSEFDEPQSTLLLRTPGARSLRPHPHMKYAVYSARRFSPKRWQELENQANSFVIEQEKLTGESVESMFDRYEASFGISR